MIVLFRRVLSLCRVAVRYTYLGFTWVATLALNASKRSTKFSIEILRILCATYPMIFSTLIAFSNNSFCKHAFFISRISLMKSSIPMSSSPFKTGIYLIVSLADNKGYCALALFWSWSTSLSLSISTGHADGVWVYLWRAGFRVVSMGSKYSVITTLLPSPSFISAIVFSKNSISLVFLALSSSDCFVNMFI